MMKKVVPFGGCKTLDPKLLQAKRVMKKVSSTNKP